MNILKKINPIWPLRLGLGFMYMYSGYDLFYNPAHWYGFTPQWLVALITRIVSMDTYLQIQGIGELIIGLLLIAWFLDNVWLRIAAALATLEMLLIIVLVGIDLITFRDIGLFGGAATLLIMSLHQVTSDTQQYGV